MTQLQEKPKPPAPPPAGAADARADGSGALEKKQDLRAHLAIYLTVNGFLWLVWAVVLPLGGPSFPWPLVSLLGWGIGLAFHAWDAMHTSRSAWKEEVEREKSRLGRLGSSGRGSSPPHVPDE